MTDKVKEHYEQLRARYFAPELRRWKDELASFDARTARLERQTNPPPTSKGTPNAPPRNCDSVLAEVEARRRLRPLLVERVEKLEREFNQTGVE